MAVTVPPSSQAAATGALDTERAVPRLAAGVELIGRFEGSGFKQPPYIARRADGQMVQMAPLLYALAEEVDGNCGHEEIGERLSHRIQRGVTGEMVEMLIAEQLRPLGIVAPEDGSKVELRKVDPLLALKFRARVVPQSLVARLTSAFQHFFHAPVVGMAIAAFAALDVWLFGFHGISQPVRHTLYDPALLLVMLGGVVVATAFHEIGHASACRFGGARPGVMGVGVYIVWPAFYTDITDAYRLDRGGRLRTDLGGVYFNALFALAVAAVYAVTGFEPLLLLVAIQNAAILQQMLPLLRLDGYYILSDLTGVPDILARIRPILVSLLPWRASGERVDDLKPWVRVAVSGYVLLLVPTLAFMVVMMLINAPRVFATGWDSFWVQWDRVGPDFSAGAAAPGAVSVLQMVMLVLPAAGIAFTTTRIVHRLGSSGWRWSEGSPARRGGLLAATGCALAIATFLWWPHGDYRPIQPGERGTIGGAVGQLESVPSGRPALTAQRQLQLGGAPTERQLQRQHRSRLGGSGTSRGSATGNVSPQNSGSGATGGRSTGGGVSTQPAPQPDGQPMSAAPTQQPQSQPAPSGQQQPPPSQQPQGTSTPPQGTTTTTPQDTTTTTTPQSTTTTQSPPPSGSGTTTTQSTP